MQSSGFFGISTVLYILAMTAYITYLVSKIEGIGKGATVLTIAGFITQTVAFLLRWKEFYEMNLLLGHEKGLLRAAPLTNLYESLIFFIWCLILGYLIIEFKYKNRAFGAFVTPVAGLALAFIEMSGMSTDISPLVPALQSNWLLVHVIMSFIAYATFGLSFATALMYLILKTEDKTEGSYIFWSVALGLFVVVLAAMGIDFIKFKLATGAMGADIKDILFRASFLSPSMVVRLISIAGGAGVIYLVWNSGHILKKAISAFKIDADILDEITYKSIAIGFPIFTLGGLIFGAIWADQAWGVYWSWDPKETWSLITWFAYAFYLHARYLRGWKEHATSIVAVVGFVAVIFTYLGVNLLLSGLHSYGGQ